MKKLNLKLASKNKESLKYFCFHLFNKKCPKRNYKLIKNCKNFANKTKGITLLKSPHVFKAAQEQFEFVNNKKKFNILVTNYKKFLVLLKRIKKNRFADINSLLTLKIQKLSNFFFLKKFLKNNLNYFIINNFISKMEKKNNVFIIKEKNQFLKIIMCSLELKKKTTTLLLKIFDIYGENIIYNNK